VISCPCALVVSVPLGYFGGIGAASRNGILFKGANYLDLMTKVNTVVMDKTGTLTKGVFKVRDIVPAEGGDNSFVALAAALEGNSNHPVAKAVTEYATQAGIKVPEAKSLEEIAGHGISGMVSGKAVLAGNSKLLDKYGIEYPSTVRSIPETTVLAAADGKYVGYITIADEVKEDAAKTVADLHGMGIKTVMLSGDKNPVVQSVASGLGIDEAHGELLPEGKAEYMEKLKAKPENVTAFVGDGINDAPVLALSDVGIAMGAMGSDAAIEVADVVIQTDQPSKLVTAIKISKATRRIVIQNITGALAVKVVVMILGAMGIASMWIAVFADVGVALLAILNSVRILRYRER
jgi:ATPase, P-type (transporting), HAD superfamily, subfamily IC/heavy metal translocating P-type ATPase